MIGKIKKFVSEVIVELKKVSWLSKRELMDNTWIVILSAGFLGIYIAVADLVLSKFVGIIIR